MTVVISRVYNHIHIVTREFFYLARDRAISVIHRFFFLFVLFSKFYAFLIIVILQHRYFFEFILLWLSFVCHELDNWEEEEEEE